MAEGVYTKSPTFTRLEGLEPGMHGGADPVQKVRDSVSDSANNCRTRGLLDLAKQLPGPAGERPAELEATAEG